MESNNFRDLYLSELQDLYDAENQLIEALPKMAAASTNAKLRAGFESHLEQTRGHAERLEQIFNSLGEDAKRKKCKGIKGLVAEGGEMIDSDFEGAVKDAGLISAAQRVEHYEIAAYGAARTFAQLLGDNEGASLLEQTLGEEKETDEKLSELADTINAQAVENTVLVEEVEEVEEIPEPEVPKRRAKGAGR
jgi:ferritin-like metal-binding protein YciE